eukprot:497854-Pyramimonas_sp.AAC.1
MGSNGRVIIEDLAGRPSTAARCVPSAGEIHASRNCGKTHAKRIFAARWIGRSIVLPAHRAAKPGSSLDAREDITGGIWS